MGYFFSTTTWFAILPWFDAFALLLTPSISGKPSFLGCLFAVLAFPFSAFALFAASYVARLSLSTCDLIWSYSRSAAIFSSPSQIIAIKRLYISDLVKCVFDISISLLVTSVLIALWSS